MSRLMQRVGTSLWACSLFACTTFGVGYSWPVVATEPLYVPSDGSLFWADIKDVGFTYDLFGETVIAGYEFSAGERSSIEQGLGYWQLMLQDNAKNSAPLRIMVIANDVYDTNASAMSFTLENGPFAGKTWLSAALADNWFGESGTDWSAYLGFVWIDHVEHGDWYTGPLDSLPQNGSTLGLTATIVHEIGHALGISALANESATIESFGSSLNLWEQGLRDSYGQKAAPNMSIVSSGNKGEGTFVTQGETAYSGVYFTGEHVEDVLQGALLSYPEDPDGYFGSYAGKMPGVPVNGWEYVGEGNGGNENGNIAELSHIELQNSLLSHQYYRNWNTLMEAEIAVMQDLGLSIDRRAWYGYSIYGSGMTLINNNPYYARENGQYLEGQPSTMPWGIGLHVYGSDNNITQQADLLADGAYAVGIRLEGQGNDLTVAKDTRIQANGLGGSALLVSYGRNHQIQLDGSAVALGPDGIAARFDFGDNLLGNNTEYRGSWFRTLVESTSEGDIESDLALPSEIQGALVNSFNVSGQLAGSKAAIYISDNALVERINILSGARIFGDIVSEWNPDGERIQTEHQNFSGTKDSLYTQLNFGQKQGHDGRLYDDSSYDFTMYGNISGQGIKLNHRAGRLSLAGTVDVYAVNNNGTMALYGVDQNGYAISTTNFTNGRDATLEACFTVDGRITRIQADQAQLAGTLALRPQTALYANEQKIDLGPVLTTESVSGAFEHTVVADYSPTLDFSLQQDKDSDGYQVTVSRKANAYSQHTANAGAASLGRALAQIASQVQSPDQSQSLAKTGSVSTTESSADHSDHSDHSDMDELLLALDWSDPDGHEVTQGLNALGANAYDIAARASLNQQSTFNTMLLQRQLSQHSPQEKQAKSAELALTATAQLPQQVQQGQAAVVPVVSEWNVWVTPYASGMWQGTASNTTSWLSRSYGLMLGADRSFSSGLKLGAHLIATDQRTKAKDELRATIDSNAVLLGVHGSYAPDEWHGGWLAAQARVGVESSDMDRTVAINGYVNSHESSWTGVIGSVLLGGGKDWQWQWQAQAQEREQSNSLLSLGPLAFVEYSFLQRPALDESKGNSSRLGVDRELYDSLRLNVGAHMSYDTVLSNGASFGVELLTAVRYELQDELKTGAHFLEYSDISFTSQNELPSNDSLLVQGALRFASPDSAFFARMDVGGEISRDDYRALQVGLQLGWFF